MRDVGGEAPFASLGLRQLLDLLFERIRHLVERGRPHAELVLPLDREPGVEQALRERLRRCARLGDGSQRPPGKQRADDPREGDEHAGTGGEDDRELAQVGVELLLGEEEVHLGLRAERLAADDQLMLAVDLGSLVGEAAAVDERLQVVRHLRLAQREARRRRLSVGDHDRFEACSSLERRDQLIGGRRVGRAVQDGRGQDERRAGLLEGAVQRVVQPRVAHEEVGAGRERSRGEARGEHEGNRQAPPEAAAGHDAAESHGDSSR